jgi:hypothetical protein
MFRNAFSVLRYAIYFLNLGVPSFQVLSSNIQPKIIIIVSGYDKKESFIG